MPKPNSRTGVVPKLTVIDPTASPGDQNRGESVNPMSARKRIAVFGAYSSDGLLPPQVLPYLAGLKPLVTAIVVVFDNDLVPGEREKLAPYASHVITGRHGEYDFGSYKRGVAWARANGLLDAADDLILCNDSCFGPVGSFLPMFETMQTRGLDFWGATDSQEFSYHLQSYFVVLSRKVFSSAAFRTFLDGITARKNVQEVIMNYELGLTKVLQEAGFSADAMVKNRLVSAHPKDPTSNNITLFPLHTLAEGLPLVKVKALRSCHTNADGQNRVLAWLKQNAPDIYDVATSDWDIKRFEDADLVAFSLIMPTHNRAWCISRAIASVLAQTHGNFELIIVDDGSSDGTSDLVTREFAGEIAQGRIRYIPLPENVGVCNARNIGLAHARNPWIGYADSDNELRPYFLTMFANAIMERPERDAFYARIIHRCSGKTFGKGFNRAELIRDNYIDLGVFVHRRSAITRFGGFDPDLQRLVDWDFIIRWSAHKEPYFIPRVLLDYSDGIDSSRISIARPFLKARVALLSKHGTMSTVSTVILGYNHQEYIAEAIESALAQRGAIEHEILLSDDGSTDGTARMMARYAEKYPGKIRNISRKKNYGVSENYRHCFREARGTYIAVLEGDDYWTDPEKNRQQAGFLRHHTDATMVFSRVRLFNTRDNSRRLLKRQDGLGELLTGANFAGDENLNPIGNLSSVMFRRSIMANLPSFLFQPRINEITLGFYLDRLGKIGFIGKVMGEYRVNASSVWSGASRVAQLEQSIAIRECALQVAKAEYRPAIRRRLDEKRRLLASLQDAAPSAAAE